MERLYAVEFMQYTDCTRDTICSDETEKKDRKYIHVGKEPFIIRESEFEKYRKFGGGFRTVKFVGNMANDSCRKPRFEQKQDALRVETFIVK